jgi:hypothetical protein
MSLITENNYGATPSVGDLEYWADNFGLTFPVLSDGGFGVAANYFWTYPGFDGTVRMPNMQLIGPGMEVLAVNEYMMGIPMSLIEANLPD